MHGNTKACFFPRIVFSSPFFPRIMYRPSQTLTDEGSIKHPFAICIGSKYTADFSSNCVHISSNSDTNEGFIKCS